MSTVLKVREQNFILETFKCCGWGTKRMHSQSTWKVASFLGLHPCPVFDCLQYMKTEEEGMVSISSHEWHQCLPSPDPKNELEAFFMLHWFHTTSSPALEFQTFVKRKMYHFWFKMKNTCTECILRSGNLPHSDCNDTGVAALTGWWVVLRADRSLASFPDPPRCWRGVWEQD